MFAGLVWLMVAAACTGNAPEEARPADRTPAALDDATSDQIVSWVDRQPVTDWSNEIAKRERAIEAYLNDSDPVRAEQYGFRGGQTPRLAWSWFTDNPVGFDGLPFVLFKTILDLDPNHESPALRRIARIWRQDAALAAGPAAAGSAWTFDHLGLSPHPSDYDAGVARPAADRRTALPFGLAFENPRSFEAMSAAEIQVLDGRLLARRAFQNTSLLVARLRTANVRENWEADRPGFGSPGTLDRVGFSCAACHVGRVTAGGRMKFLAGMPNTEVSPQYVAKLLMLTGAALVVSGIDLSSAAPVNPAAVQPDVAAIRALYTEMLDKARQRPETLYGPAPEQIARAKIQTLAIADAFPQVVQELVASTVVTHFVEQVFAGRNAYRDGGADITDLRPGQMDALGSAAAFVALHTRRPDNSFLEFISRDNPKNPVFAGFSKATGLPGDIAGMTDAVTDTRSAGDRIFRNIPAWAPSRPAPSDIPSVTRVLDRFLGAWDGGQGASSAVLTSGATAAGDPRTVNVRIHEPLGAFVDNLPPSPYPFGVDLRRAREGKALFRQQCATCHTPRNQTIYPAAMLGVDPNRSLMASSVTRYGFAALIAEACTIFGFSNAGTPGADWCVPPGDWQARLDEYFSDTPRRVAAGTNGYKADALHGVWAQAPYLHNGSVPTLAHLICASTRPSRFLRGNVNYDEALVGFEWAEQPRARYGPNDTVLVRPYETSQPGNRNGGHAFGAELCPDTSGLDPVTDRQQIGKLLLDSRVGALLAYLKTL